MQKNLQRRVVNIFIFNNLYKSSSLFSNMKKELIFLIISDVLILSSFGFITPIFAIFIKEGVTGGSILAAGLASTIFWAVKSVTQIPLSRYIDTKKTKLSFLIAGTFLIVLVPLFYAFSPNIKFIYLGQVVYAFGTAMAYPAWFSLFVKFIDKKHRGFEWSIWSTGIGLGTALTAYIGASLAESIGFRNLFFIVSAISFLGMLSLFLISKKNLREIEKIESHLIPRFNKTH